MDQQQLKLFRSWLQESRRAVFFGGAGVSTESGVPDFRSPDGLYHQQYAYPPEEILSRSFFDRNPETFYDFYREKILCCLDVQPNRTHRFLAALEEAGHLAAVVRQNRSARVKVCPGAAVVALSNRMWCSMRNPWISRYWWSPVRQSGRLTC